MVRVEIYQPKTDRFAQNLAFRETKELVTVVTREAKIITLRYTGNSHPDPTGHLSRSIHGNVGRKGRYLVVGSVGSNDPKAHVVHDGARPHWMRPRLAGGMKFYWKAKGRYVCIKVPILHTGMNGKFYLVEPLKIEGRRLGWYVITSSVVERLVR